MNKLAKIFFITLCFNKAQSMEETESKNAINYFKMLPTELNEIIARSLISPNVTSEDQIKKIIVDLKNLCFVNQEFYYIINSQSFTKYVIIALNKGSLNTIKIALLLNTPGASQLLKTESKTNHGLKNLVILYRLKENTGKRLIASRTITQKNIKSELKDFVEQPHKINNIYSYDWMNSDKELEYIINSERFAKFVIKTVNKKTQITPIKIALYLPTTGAAQWLKSKSQNNCELKSLINKRFLKAIKKKKVNLAIHLLIAGADVNSKDESGTTILMLFSDSESTADAKIVEIILQANADPDVTNNQGQTSLILATLKENIKIVQELLKAKANPNIKDHSGNTALNYASIHSKKAHNRTAIINMLKRAGAQGRINIAIANLALNGLQIH